MSTKTYVLRGYVKQRPDGRVVGVYLRPNLVVEGKTLHEAQHKLEQLIHAYISDSVKDGNLEHFMAQRAPIRFYAQYWIGRVLLDLSHSFKSFTTTCHAPQLA